jgi:hypothetical protein
MISAVMSESINLSIEFTFSNLLSSTLTTDSTLMIVGCFGLLIVRVFTLSQDHQEFQFQTRIQCYSTKAFSAGKRFLFGE